MTDAESAALADDSDSEAIVRRQDARDLAGQLLTSYAHRYASESLAEIAEDCAKAVLALHRTLDAG